MYKFLYILIILINIFFNFNNFYNINNYNNNKKNDFYYKNNNILIDNIKEEKNINNNPFHKDINIDLSLYKDNKKMINHFDIDSERDSFSVSAIPGNYNYYNRNKKNKSEKIFIINWNKYEKNWQDFIKYYPSFFFNYDFYLEINNKNLNNKNFYYQKNKIINTNNFKENNNKIIQLEEIKGNNSVAFISLILIKEKHNLYIYLTCETNVVLNLSSYEILKIKSNIVSIQFNSSFDFDFLKKDLENKINNYQELIIYSDHSSQLVNNLNNSDNNNNIFFLLNKMIIDVFGEHYNNGWRNFILPYDFDFDNNLAIIIFYFYNPVSKKQEKWIFNKKINIYLSDKYFLNDLKSRIFIYPGKNENNIYLNNNYPHQLISLKNLNKYEGGLLRFNTSVFIIFESINILDEEIFINNNKIPIINNKVEIILSNNGINFYNSNYKLKSDYFFNEINRYEIKLFNNKNPDYIYFNFEIIIDNKIPSLNFEKYKFINNNNNNQKKINFFNILDNESINCNKFILNNNNYNKIKKQIIWVKNKSKLPFLDDPLENNETNTGFIAEGSVVNSGIIEKFDNFNLYKEKVSFLNLQPFSLNKNNSLISENFNNIKSKDLKNLEKNKFNNNNNYFSDLGVWHYYGRYLDNNSNKFNQNYYKNINIQKFIIIHDKYNENFHFSDIINNEDIVIDFWETIHGFRLKYYLLNFKFLSIDEIEKISYEQVIFYWREYVSYIYFNKNNKKIFLDLQKKYLNLSNFKNIFLLKINEFNVENIKNKLIKIINKKLFKFDIVYNEDYKIFIKNKEINDICSIKELNKLLLNYDNNIWSWLEIEIKSLSKSKKIFGKLKINIGNNKKFDKNISFDLSNIYIENQIYNFSNFSLKELKKWIFFFIEHYLFEINNDLESEKNYVIDIFYTNDQLKKFIESNDMDNNFINKGLENYSNEIVIYINSINHNLSTYNFTNFKIINDKNKQNLNKNIYNKSLFNIKEFDFLNNKNKDNNFIQNKIIDYKYFFKKNIFSLFILFLFLFLIIIMIVFYIF